MDPPLISAQKKQAAVEVCSFFFFFFFVAEADPLKLGMYFIFDLTGALCQCTVLINRVTSPERSSLSPILFQESSAAACGATWATNAGSGCVTVRLAPLQPTNDNKKRKRQKKETLHPCRVCAVHKISTPRFLHGRPLKEQSHMYRSTFQV